MSTSAYWWDGKALSGSEICLAVIPSSPGSAGHLLGAAHVIGNTVLLAPEQLASFLELHASRCFVTCDVGSLHWLLVAHFSGRERQAEKTLWQLSREARLIDVTLLDQHVRRCRDHGGIPRPRSITEIAKWLERISPTQETAAAAAGEDPDDAMRNQDDAALEDHGQPETSVIRLAETLSLVYQGLVADATGILGEAIPDLRKFGKLDAADSDSSLSDSAVCRQMMRRYGPLGIGIDVKAAIALWHPIREGLRVDSKRWKAVLEESNRRYAGACQRIRADDRMRNVFSWSGDHVERWPKGFPKIDKRCLRGWLKAIARELRHADGKAVDIPSVDSWPSTDPEEWDVWASCHALLAAWRDLVRAGQTLALAEPIPADIRPDYLLVPAVGSRRPHLRWTRSLGLHPFVPREGRIFLVGQLSELRVRCLVAVCRRFFGKADTARLELLLQADPESLAPYSGWLEAAAGVVYREVTSSNDVDALLEQNSAERQRWMTATRGLLEAMPYRLPPERLRPYLDAEYGVDVNLSEIQGIQNALVNTVEPVLQVFLRQKTMKDIVQDWLHRRSSFGDDVALPGVGSLNKAIPQLQGNREAPAEAENMKVPNKVAQKLRMKARMRGLTGAGRLTLRVLTESVVEQIYEMTVDEVLKAVLYQIVFDGYRLTAVVGTEFVLEISKNRALESELNRVSDLAQKAQAPLLGTLACPCTCGWQQAW